MEKNTDNAAFFWSSSCVWLATGLGVGLVTPAPGTVGGLWGIPLAWAIGQLASPALRLLVIAVILLLAVAVCGKAARQLGRNDPGEVVLDEIAVLPIVFVGTGVGSWKLLLVGWLLFRVFDILKPFPIREVERLPGGWGVMADDVLAAIYAALVLSGLVWLDASTGWGWLATKQ